MSRVLVSRLSRLFDTVLADKPSVAHDLAVLRQFYVGQAPFAAIVGHFSAKPMFSGGRLLFWLLLGRCLAVDDAGEEALLRMCGVAAVDVFFARLALELPTSRAAFEQLIQDMLLIPRAVALPSAGYSQLLQLGARRPAKRAQRPADVGERSRSGRAAPDSGGNSAPPPARRRKACDRQALRAGPASEPWRSSDFDAEPQQALSDWSSSDGGEEQWSARQQRLLAKIVEDGGEQDWIDVARLFNALSGDNISAERLARQWRWQATAGGEEEEK